MLYVSLIMDTFRKIQNLLLHDFCTVCLERDIGSIVM
jgi:hypothetical protein